MDKILSLYNELNSKGVNFYLWELGEAQAATVELNGQYGVFMDFDNIKNSAEELTLVAHEGGHIVTGSTHYIGSPFEVVEQHENRADKWAIKQLIPKQQFDTVVSDGHTELWDLAEYFGVTEDFMKKAVCWYKYGTLAVDQHMQAK